MHEARADASSIHFPAGCARCDGPAETVHHLTAKRGIDLIFVSAHQEIELPVPLCRSCRRRRRIVGAVNVAGTLAVVIGGGFLGTQLAIDDVSTIGAGVVFVAVVVLALVERFRGDALVEISGKP